LLAPSISTRRRISAHCSISVYTLPPPKSVPGTCPTGGSLSRSDARRSSRALHVYAAPPRAAFLLRPPQSDGQLDSLRTCGALWRTTGLSGRHGDCASDNGQCARISADIGPCPTDNRVLCRHGDCASDNGQCARISADIGPCPTDNRVLCRNGPYSADNARLLIILPPPCMQPPSAHPTRRAGAARTGLPGRRPSARTRRRRRRLC
jgi:hypothetical protein